MPLFPSHDPNGVRPEAISDNQLTNLNRRSDRDPHFFGSVKIDGVWYQIATWINDNNGIQNLSSAYSVMTVEQAMKAEKREQEYQAERAKRANPLSAPPVNPLAGAKTEDQNVAQDPLADGQEPDF